MDKKDKRKELNPAIVLDDDRPIDPHAEGFIPKDWTKDEISFYFDKALKVLNSENYTTAAEYIDLLVNQCLAEKNWSDAFTYFLTKVKEMGLEIETNQKSLNDLNDKLFYWRTVRMMIHAAGLIRYEEEIIKYEIAKYYQPSPAMLPPPRVQGVPLDRTRRKKPEAKPSIFRPEPKPKPAAVAPIPKPAAKPPARINKPGAK